MIVYIAKKMDIEIVKQVSGPDGLIGVMPVFESLTKLKEAFGEDAQYFEYEWKNERANYG